MSHKTLVNGTVYEVGGGKTLIDGTAYSIKSGKTLVGGTAYEVGFAPAEATVTFKSNVLTQNSAYTEIDGTRYFGKVNYTETVIVPTGTVIICTAKCVSYNGSALGGTITLNGTVVAETKTTSTPATYEYTVMCDVTFTFNATTAPNGQNGGTITITEQ